jgi:hypothetical protein
MPKGVYPRRKAGRPSTTVKIQPKPLSIREQFTTLYDFLTADPEYKRLDDLHTGTCKTKNSFETDIRTETFKMQRLLIARDLVIQGSNELDYPETSVDELLKTSTGNDSEMWGGMLCGAANDLTDLITDKCCAIASLAKQRDEQAAKGKELYAQLDKRREALRDQWNAAELPPSTVD